MYKVFHNQHTLIFSLFAEQNTGHGESTTLITDLEIKSVHKQIHKALKNQANRLIAIYHPEIAEIQREFCAFYYPVEASGGVVRQDKTLKTLVIKKKGCWDLPKGKCDKGESSSACAIRETTEETGIIGLNVISPAYNTQHIYKMDGTWHLKRTSWYLMQTADPNNPVPQLNEGISEARWATDAELQHTVQKNTYPLIRDVLRHFELI